MKVSRKIYYDAYQYLGPEKTPEGMFQIIAGNMNTEIDKRGKLQFYYNAWEHIGVPVGYWLVIDHTAETNEQKYKVYNNENFKKLFTPEEDEKFLKHTTYGCNPVYPERPYPNNIHAIKTELGLSNEKLGALCGLGYTTIANFDRGDRPIEDYYKKLIEDGTGYKVERYYES